MLLLALAVMACRSGGPTREGSSGTHGGKAVVRYATPRGPYLDVVLAGEVSRRYFLRSTASCRAVAAEGGTLRVSRVGPWGTLETADHSCVPAGIGSLSYWRDARPEGSNPPAPRSQARFRIVFSDRDYAFARGRFALASAIGWSGGEDTVAVIPITEECSPSLERGIASMQFQQRGTHPFTLIGEGGLCPILGFIRPDPLR